jgi:tetratricopeptide (TPR) repeat protein
MRTAADLPDAVRELVTEGRDAWRERDYDRARSLFEQALAAAETMNDRFAEMSALHFLGNVAFNQCRDEESRRLHEAALALARREGDEQGVATSLGSIALVDVAGGDFAAAEMRFADSADSYERAGMADAARSVREKAEALVRDPVALATLIDRRC